MRRAQLDGFQILEQRWAAVPGCAVRAMHDVVPVLGRDRDDGDFQTAKARRQLLQLFRDLGEPGLVEVDKINLVHRCNKMLDA